MKEFRMDESSHVRQTIVRVPLAHVRYVLKFLYPLEDRVCFHGGEIRELDSSYLSRVLTDGESEDRRFQRSGGKRINQGEKELGFLARRER